MSIPPPKVDFHVPRTAVVPMPLRVARLPRDKHGYPIPWFVATLPDGTRDFRIADDQRKAHALQFGNCWICGQRVGVHKAFVIGPMCAVNRITAEPPCHRECAIFAALACPFLSTPSMRRRDKHIPEGALPPAGDAILRNPGVSLIWVTRTYRTFQAQLGEPGLLIDLGEPEDLLWYREGRTATRAEILESMAAGLPLLQAACEQDADPAESLLLLVAQYDQALKLVPA